MTHTRTLTGPVLTLLTATFLTASTPGISVAHAADRVGRVFFENRSPDEIKLDITKYVDANGVERDPGVVWTLKPNQKAYLRLDKKTLMASKVEYTVKSSVGTRRWASVPANLGSDGKLKVYHARPAVQVRYKNSESTSVTLRCTSYIDKYGITRKGKWEWKFAPGQLARLEIDNVPLLASRFEYTAIGPKSQKLWYKEYQDFSKKSQFLASGGPGTGTRNVTLLRPKTGTTKGLSDQARNRIIGKLLGAWAADAIQDAALANEESPIAGFLIGGIARAARTSLIEDAIREAAPGQPLAVRSAMTTVVDRMFDGKFNPKALTREVIEIEIIRELKRHNTDAANFVEGVDFLADLFEARSNARK